MPPPRLLYVSGSLGLGHVVRDIAIARELRRLLPGLRISWLASSPASDALRDAGEELLPESSRLSCETGVAERASLGGRLNIMQYLMGSAVHMDRNARTVARVANAGAYDLVVGDETFDVATGMIFGTISLPCPFAMIVDFVGLDADRGGLLDRAIAYFFNAVWSRDRRIYKRPDRLGIFVGEPDDVLDKPLGFLLPNRRDHAIRSYRFVGYVLPFDPADYRDKSAIRKALGYGDEPLVVCAVGGTAIGRQLLELCARAFVELDASLPGLRMILVCGPRLQPSSVHVPPGPEIVGYVPRLYEHLAASDLAIVQGGGTTTLELTALRRPFIYFPVEGHFEQENCVAGRLARHAAGTRMTLSKTTPGQLAETALGQISGPASWDPISTDGAQIAATHIAGLLARS